MQQPLVEKQAGGSLSVADWRTRFMPVSAAIAAACALLAIMFLPEIRAAVSTWNTSTAYGHCYLVLPMALYLVWERRTIVAAVPIRPQPVFALLALPIAAVWLVAERLGIMEGRQLMALTGLQLMLLTTLGWRMYWALLGPMLFLFFLVPFGAFLTPALQQFTARFAVAGLNVLGIPNFSNDLIIEIPEGTFFVAEACAGLRFLIAAVAFGVFYALLNYRSPVRQLLFIIASILVPIVANGFRALGIVALGHILGSAEAAAADHIIYGWVFFSFVMLLLVACGLPFREAPAAAVAHAPRLKLRSGPAPVWAAAAACALIVVGPAAARVFDMQAAPSPFAAVPNLRIPAGCERVGETPSVPATRFALVIDCAGQRLDLVIEAFPPRSTAAALTAERRRATGELGAEDATYSSLGISGESMGEWTLVQTTDPFRTTALAAWVDGKPARGGLSGRVGQARDSLFGSMYAPVLMSIGTRETGRLYPEQQQTLVQMLRTIIEAQPGLSAQIVALSRRG